MDILFWAVAFFYLAVIFGAAIISIFKKDADLKNEQKPSIISVYDYENQK